MGGVRGGVGMGEWVEGGSGWRVGVGGLYLSMLHLASGSVVFFF